MRPRFNFRPLIAVAFAIALIALAALSGLKAYGQTHPTTTTAPATQPATKPTPQVVIILGYGTTDGLIRYVDNFWRPKIAPARLMVTTWDHDVASEIAATYPTGDVIIVGFSHGGWKAIEVAKGWASPTRGPPRNVKRMVLVDPVPYPNPKPLYAGFDLSENIGYAVCFWRGYNNQHELFSGPIRSAKCDFVNWKFNPKPLPPTQGGEGGEHGEFMWRAETISAVKAGF